MKDLVYDPVTGDFRQVPRGTHHGNGDVVTEMTDKGFALDAETLQVYVKEQDIESVREALCTKEYVRGYGEVLDGEVVHVYMDEDDVRRSKGQMPVFFTDDEKEMSESGVWFLVTSEDASAFLVADEGRKSLQFDYIPSAENIFSRSKGIRRWERLWTSVSSLSAWEVSGHRFPSNWQRPASAASPLWTSTAWSFTTFLVTQQR
jgi:hypothetical protein